MAATATFAALFVLIFLLGHVAGRMLPGAAWCRRLPRVATAVWIGALSGTVAAVMGLVVLVFLDRPGAGHRVVEWALACLAHHHERSSGAWAYTASLIPLAAALTGTGIAVRRYVRTLGRRRRHREALDLVVWVPGGLRDVVVIDHPLPVVYCVPSRTRPIVVSSGTFDRLDRAQFEAVLEHERAHLRRHHHLVLAVADALGVALPWLATFRRSRIELPALLEMVADDIAAGAHGTQAVAAALRTLAFQPCPAGGLAAGPAGGSALATRLDRLDRSPADDGLVRHPFLTRTATAASLAVPIVICAGWIATVPVFC